MQQAQSPQSPDARALQTFGPTRNEQATQYARNGAAHNVVSLTRVSADVMLGHAARVAAFYRRLGETPPQDATGRDTRDQVLRAEVLLRPSAPPPVRRAPPSAIPLGAAPSIPVQVGSGGFGAGPFGVGGFGT